MQATAEARANSRLVLQTSQPREARSSSSSNSDESPAKRPRRQDEEEAKEELSRGKMSYCIASSKRRQRRRPLPIKPCDSRWPEEAPSSHQPQRAVIVEREEKETNRNVQEMCPTNKQSSQSCENDHLNYIATGVELSLANAQLSRRTTKLDVEPATRKVATLGRTYSKNSSGSRLLFVAVAIVAVFITCLCPKLLHAQQYRPDWPSKLIQQEIFLLNLEDGYFGCQVNESQDFLQLFELSRLCDGQAQCYRGTDEIVSQLKCNQRDQCGTASPATALVGPAASNRQLQQQQQLAEPIQCVNGVCLDGLCYCNDGWGGKSCDVPDENECKYRPCDVFAHCTNTMGSYYCSCFPGKFSGLQFLRRLS